MLLNVYYLVLTGLILSTDKGEVKLATFLDDRAMHSLYEKFILEYYRYHHPEYKANTDTIPWNIDDGAIEILPAMVTDITLKYGERTLIIDAKKYRIRLSVILPMNFRRKKRRKSLTVVYF